MNIDIICDQVHSRFPELKSSMVNEKTNSILFFDERGCARCALVQENDGLALKTLDTAPIDEHNTGARAETPSHERNAEITAMILRKK